MDTISLTNNLDLFAVGITVAATLLLGFLVFFRNTKGVTARAFLFFTIVSAGWSVVNYISYQSAVFDTLIILWLVRFVMFTAVWQSFAFFLLMYVIPYEDVPIPRQIFRDLLPMVVVTSILTLTPLVFPSITLTEVGQVSIPTPGVAIIIFAAINISLVAGGIYLLIKKLRRSAGDQRKQMFMIALGMTTMFSLVIIFDFLSIIFFKNTRFIPLSAVFVFPFVICTYYAIARYRFLNVKVLATEATAFFLIGATLLEILFSPHNSILLILRAGIFCLVLAFSILLIKSVLKEVKQKEELQELAQKLEAANGQLQELNRFKTQLLSLASHQIKSPLAAIKGFTDILMQGLYGALEPKVKETLQKITQSTNDLLDLINSLLDLRKIEEGRMDYQFVKTDLVPIVATVVDQLKPLIQEKKLEFTLTSPEIPIFANVDGQKIRQVFQNLVDNAIKYTPSGFVKVVLEVAKDGGTNFAVVDSGLGMSAETQKAVFGEFVRDSRVKLTIRGTGLGLSIAKKIVEAHRGRIWAHSEGEGRGSDFYVWLPKA